MKLMRNLGLMLLLFLLAIPAAAQDVSLTVTGYGIIRTGGNYEKVQETGTVLGTRTVFQEGAVVERTRTIPGTTGTSFGFCYELSNVPAGQQITLTKITAYPSAMTNPSTGVLKEQDSYDLKLANGRHHSFFIFEEPWEIIPGTWTFELWHGDTLLTRQEFEVYLP